MPVDLATALVRDHTALVVLECQEGIVGAASHLPNLAASARTGDVIGRIVALADAARTARVPVVFCTFDRHGAGGGTPLGTPLARRLGDTGRSAPPPMGDIVGELAPRDGDLVVDRASGLTGFHGTELDDHLRGLGVRTVVLTGVSVNLGVIGTAIEAANRGYTVVVPTDCVAGDPPEYAEQALRYTIRNVAYLSTSTELARLLQ